MSGVYAETGGMRWGESFWRAFNATWPFARLTASASVLRVEVSFWKFWNRSFEFTRPEIRGLRRKHGVLSGGLVIEHGKPVYPPFILFWTFSFRNLKRHLEGMGYTITQD